MRFGIMANQLGLVLATIQQGAGGDYSPPALLRQVANYDIVTHVSRIADAGFRIIELNTDLERFLPGCYSPAAVERLGELAVRRDLSYTVHTPIWSVDLGTPEPRVRPASVAAVVDAIRRFAPLRPETYVVHPTGEMAAEFARLNLPAPARALVLGLFVREASASLAEVLAETKVEPRRLALENVGFPLEHALALAEQFDTSLCLDTGHIIAGFSGEVSLAEALERMLPRLAEIHLHDAYRRPDGVARDHLPLGQGSLDQAWLLDRLAAAGFGGPLIFEVSLEDAAASLQALRALRPGLVPR